MDLVLNNLQRLICHKTQANQTTNTCNHITVCKQIFNIEENYKSLIAIIVTI